jgi:hypothetical protein
VTSTFISLPQASAACLPCGLQAGVRERRLQWFVRFREFIGQRGIETCGGHVGAGYAERAGAEQEVAAILFDFVLGVRHLGSLVFATQLRAFGLFN